MTEEFAMKPKNEVKLRIFSWNTNSFRGLGIKLFEKQKYTALERLPTNQKVFQYCTQDFTKDGLFALQEIEDGIVPNLKEFWEKHNYQVITTKYNPDKMALNFVFAYDPNIWTVGELPQIYLTKNGRPWCEEEKKLKEENQNIDEKLLREKQIEHNLCNEHTRSAQMLKLTHKETKKTFVISNNHFGLPNAHKLDSAKELCKKLQDIQDALFAMGDFNQFEKDKIGKLYEQQINVFKESNFCWQSEEFEATFLPFPYDTLFLLSKAEINQYKKLLEELSLAEKEQNMEHDVQNCREKMHQFFLDQIKNFKENGISLLDVAYDAFFTKNLQKLENEKPITTKSKVLFFEKGERIKPCPSREEINERATKLYCKDEEAPYSSDHFPIKMSVHI